MGEWDGKERRAEHVDLSDLYNVIHELKDKLNEHILEESQIRPHLIELVDILQRFKGVVVFFKVLIYVGAPLAAVYVWAKDHIK